MTGNTTRLTEACKYGSKMCIRDRCILYVDCDCRVSSGRGNGLSENREKRGKGRVDMRYQEYMDIIRTVNDRFRYYKSIESLFELDQWSGLPELGGTYRQQMSAFVAVSYTHLVL